MKTWRTVALAVGLVVGASVARCQTWQPLNNQPNFKAGTMLLLTDGTVLVHSEPSASQNWYKHPLSKALTHNCDHQAGSSSLSPTATLSPAAPKRFLSNRRLSSAVSSARPPLSRYSSSDLEEYLRAQSNIFRWCFATAKSAAGGTRWQSNLPC
jgi:hypothetical protein